MEEKKEQTLLAIIGVFMGLIGLVMIGVWSSWWVSVGIFLVLWGDNIGESLD